MSLEVIVTALRKLSPVTRNVYRLSQIGPLPVKSVLERRSQVVSALKRTQDYSAALVTQKELLAVG